MCERGHDCGRGVVQVEYFGLVDGKRKKKKSSNFFTPGNSHCKLWCGCCYTSLSLFPDLFSPSSLDFSSLFLLFFFSRLPMWKAVTQGSKVKIMLTVWKCGRKYILAMLRDSILKVIHTFFFPPFNKNCTYEHLLLKQWMLLFMIIPQTSSFLCRFKIFLVFFFPTLNLLFYITGVRLFCCLWKYSRWELHLPNVSGSLPHPCVSAFVSPHPSLSLHGGWVASVTTAGALAACFSFS